MKNNYKTKFMLLTILLALGSSAHGQDEAVDPYVDRLTIPFSNDSDRRLKARLLQGSITVTGYDGDEVIVEAQKRNHKKEAPSQNGMKRIDLPSTGLFAEEYQNEIKVGSKNMGDTVDLTIQVPFETSLNLHSINNGDIYVESVTGEIDVENVNGGITVQSVSGVVLAHALNSDVVVSLNDIYEDTPMSFTSLNGTIDVTLPATTRASLKMETFNGKIESDFDIDLGTNNREPIVHDTRAEGGSYRLEFETGLSGTINGGGPQFVFKTHNGDIRIRKKEAE